MFYIILVILIEIITMTLTGIIISNGIIDAILEIYNNGYKFKFKALENHFDSNGDSKQLRDGIEKNKQSNIINILNNISLFIPGVNLINALVRNAKLKKEVMDIPEVKENMALMTDSEKKMYSMLTRKIEKFKYAYFLSNKKYEEEVLLSIGDGVFLTFDYGCIKLRYDKLLPLSYNLDEVKRLNEVTNLYYKVGKLGGRNVAIIGLPIPDFEFKRVMVADDNNSVFDFQELTNEEASKSRFIVYSYTIDKMDELNKKIEEIKQNREETRNIISTKFRVNLMARDDTLVVGPSIKRSLRK